MPALKLAVNADLSGLVVPDFPYIRRLEFAEAVAIEYDQVTGASFVDIPGQTVLTSVQVLILSANQDVTVRMSAQSDAGALLKSGGLLVLFNCDITAVKVQNNSGSTAHIQGLLMGA